MYLSPLLNKDLKELDGRRKRQMLKDSGPSSLVGAQTAASGPPKPIEVLPCHSLTQTRIVEHLGSSKDLARMLADYRASGGRIRQKEAADPFGSAGPRAGAGCQGRLPGKADGEEDKQNKQSDTSWTPKVSPAPFSSQFMKRPVFCS